MSGFFSKDNIILLLIVTLLIKLLSPTMNSLGQKLSVAITNRLEHIPKFLTKLISQMPSFLFLLTVIFLAFYFFSLIPKDTVRLGDKSYIKHNKKTNELIIYTDGKPQALFSKDGLILAKDLSVTGSIYSRDIAVDMTEVTPDEVLNILKSSKGITLVKEEIAKEVIKSLKAEGIIKESPSK